MYSLHLITATGKRVVIVGTTRRAVMAVKAPDCFAWRLFDHSRRGGWCDGSDRAWLHIGNAQGGFRDCVIV